jgi:hypothetical protein
MGQVWQEVQGEEACRQVGGRVSGRTADVLSGTGVLTHTQTHAHTKVCLHAHTPRHTHAHEPRIQSSQSQHLCEHEAGALDKQTLLRYTVD